ncbi:hypothetical protein FMEXI_11512 [Fusarium mexicanum]|uniref:Uncharacterized protein n=1 Tax=Fusarium mexicanum TaxID=751941 RepID=A0A8H5IDS6_9HYPO|nr:hypothetical protein FMEXI_11512 [Fusarium mexicanum]
MNSQASFLHLPREVRDMIYSYALEDVEFSNAFTTQTAYSPQNFPLLYMHHLISQDLQHQLYKHHDIVIPIQEPSSYATGSWSIVPRITCSKMMKQRSKTLVIEMSQTTISYYPDSDLEEDENEDPMEDESFWAPEGRGGQMFPQKLINDILALKPSLPSVTTLKLVFWFGYWISYVEHWEEHLKKLKDKWPEVVLNVQLNLFDFADPDAGDTGWNFIEGWYWWSLKTEGVWFEANNFAWKDHMKGDFRGRNINVSIWQDALDYDCDEFDKLLHPTGCEVRPMFVRTCDLDGRVKPYK